MLGLIVGRIPLESPLVREEPREECSLRCGTLSKQQPLAADWFLGFNLKSVAVASQAG